MERFPHGVCAMSKRVTTPLAMQARKLVIATCPFPQVTILYRVTVRNKCASRSRSNGVIFQTGFRMARCLPWRD